MAEWLIEDGIGERRALLIESGQAIAARVEWPGDLAAGTRASARLTSKLAGTRRGVALLECGAEALVDHLPPSVTEGQIFDVVITRAPVAERGRLKRAQGRALTADVPGAAPAPFVQGRHVRHFPAGLWEDVWHAASAGEMAVPGGAILLSVTPAMTVIDVDGIGAPRDVTLAAVPAIAQALRWFDLAGNIGIDFPTLAAKPDRRMVDEVLDAALADWPHERTAMNGFGFVQIVARLERPSLLHRFATARLGASARMALRRAELAQGTGRVLLLTVHPALLAKLKDEWIAALARRTGREVRIASDPALAIEAAHAQLVAS